MRLLGLVPTICVIGLMASGRATSFDPAVMRPVGLLLALAAIGCTWVLQIRGNASPIHMGLTGFVTLGAAGQWVWPGGLGRLVSAQPMFCLYAVLFLVAVGPPLVGRDPFTTHFARKTAPEAVWKTDIFLNINRNMTRIWAGLFGLSAAITLLPTVLPSVIESKWLKHVFWDAIPVGLMLVGARFNKWYPDRYQRRVGLKPFDASVASSPDGDPDSRGASSAHTCRELLEQMPLGFRSDAAKGLTAAYQFEVTDEGFVAHLSIADRRCSFSEGPADQPDVVIRTPGAVWLAIAHGEMDGQQAFLDGRYEVEGDVALLMKLGDLFGSPR